MSGDRVLISAGRVVTCDVDGDTVDGDLGVIVDGAVLIQGDKIAAVGQREALSEQNPNVRLEHYPDSLITPGLVDAHTHAVWAGSRENEYAMRMRGADYEEIGRAGGGIVASMRAVREASREQLTDLLEARLKRMAAMGVTTVEVKSGYGLDESSERRQLEAVAALAGRADLPRLVPTFLGMHALPPEANGDREAHARRCRTWLDGIARDELARYVDAYIDRSAFSVEQARPVLERARELGLGVRVHVGQFADVGGVELAVELAAASVDHLEHVSEEGAAALAASGVVAVLLPVASFTLAQAPPPVAMLRAQGVSLAVASDANPGTAPTESLPLAMALAVRSYEMSVSETIAGVTRVAAHSLGLATGVLRDGADADLVVWNLPHEDALVQPWGVPRSQLVLRQGKTLATDVSN